ncbi:hypothetical protein PR202_ga15661 [Eleusine coracana subsp. coracana]|uniref:GOLD domain-containing protein n=1 Tax=Eleusine coracana subsp. coracana TaxID=191504 RepID=A0AAV5CJL4_ELECO|nr:hypothetical protein PR202_ga15661 [Eleusine coracana subsp. coracana]
MVRGGEWAAAAVVGLWWMATGAGAVWLEIPPSAIKCVSEDIQSNVVVIGDYSVLYEHHHAHPTVSVKLKLGIIWLASQLTEDTGLMMKLNLEWKIGIATKDWDSVAKMEKIEGVELELVKLEASVQAIHENLLLLKSKFVHPLHFQE